VHKLVRAALIGTDAVFMGKNMLKMISLVKRLIPVGSLKLGAGSWELDAGSPPDSGNY
jgi:hypothetical protein